MSKVKITKEVKRRILKTLDPVLDNEVLSSRKDYKEYTIKVFKWNYESIIIELIGREQDGEV